LRGSTGSGLRGSTGSGLRGLDQYVFESAAIGPIGAIIVTDDGARLMIVGQTYDTSVEIAGSVVEGEYVVAAGNSEGQLQVLYSMGSEYVAGASAVMVRGPVKAADTSVANLSVGDAVLDYSSHLAVEPAYIPESGDLIEARGVQPSPGGKLIVGLQDRALVSQRELASD
jgi:hypothetical protein